MSDIDIRELFETDGKQMKLIKLLPLDRILCWDQSGKSTKNNWTGMGGGQTDIMRIVKLEDIDFSLIKSMKVFSILSDEVKHKLENHIRIIRDEVGDRMAKAREARKDRKSKYENIPEEIACSVCNNVVEAVPSKIAAYCNRKNILLADYIKNFKCSKCADPVKRGKQANPLYASLPKELVCKCGARVALNPSNLKAKAERLGITMQEAIEGYSCQVCSPSKGRPRVEKAEKVSKAKKDINPNEMGVKNRKGRKPNPEFEGLPKRMACIGCGKEVASNLDYLKVKAEKLGVTIKSLIEGYKCSACKKI